jgi:hypothetical protein
MRQWVGWTPSNPFTFYYGNTVNVNSGRNSICVVHKEGYGGSNILGRFSILQKAESFRKKFKEIIQISILLLLTSGTLG